VLEAEKIFSEHGKNPTFQELGILRVTLIEVPIEEVEQSPLRELKNLT
jgi:hypothetical protein